MNIFSGHLVWGALTLAANVGITTNYIFEAADWSSESAFRKFYYRPVSDPSFGRSVLASDTSWVFAYPSSLLQATNNTIDTRDLAVRSIISKWLKSCNDCMKVKSCISMVPPTHPTTTICFQKVKVWPSCWVFMEIFLRMCMLFPVRII